MYNTDSKTGYSTKVSRNIFVAEDCPNIDFRYGPFNSTEEAMELLIKAGSPQLGQTVGILQQDGSIEEYWFKTDTETLVKKLSSEDGLYRPGEDIPNGATSDKISGMNKESLSRLTVSQVLDKLLFSEKSAYFTAGTCSLSSNATDGQLEVGTIHSSTNYTATPATATFGYPAGSKSWTAGSISVTNSTVQFGSNNKASCTFTLQQLPEYLQSSFGVPTATSDYLRSHNISTEQIKSATSTGFYYYAWSYKGGSGVYTWNTAKMTANLSNTKINCTGETEDNRYIYLALPVVFRVNNIKVKHPLSNDYIQLDSGCIVKIASDQSIASISSKYKFNIWKLSKANHNNDGTPTGNNQPLQITTSNA